LCDPNTFCEFEIPYHDLKSPHLTNLNLPARDDDGVIIGKGLIDGYKASLISQDGTYYGGSVGEIHGARIKGIIDYSIRVKIDVVIFIIDSGGVRLHEANAGLVALSEVIKSLLNIKILNIPIIAVVPGKIGAFGGMGILVRLCSKIIMTEKGRIGLSGPEVIETLKGIEEFDSHDKDFVYETVGARQRKEIKEIDYLVNDTPKDIKNAIIQSIKTFRENKTSFYQEIIREHRFLKERLNRYKI
jgi:malonate decarboxylase beta subunit